MAIRAGWFQTLYVRGIIKFDNRFCTRIRHGYKNIFLQETCQRKKNKVLAGKNEFMIRELSNI